MDPVTRTNGGLTISPGQAFLMIERAKTILNRASEVLREHPRAAAPSVLTAFAQIEWLAKCSTFEGLAPAYGLTPAQAQSYVDLPAPTAQQRQNAQNFEREVEQHA